MNSGVPARRHGEAGNVSQQRQRATRISLISRFSGRYRRASASLYAQRMHCCRWLRKLNHRYATMRWAYRRF